MREDDQAPYTLTRRQIVVLFVAILIPVALLFVAILAIISLGVQ